MASFPRCTWTTKGPASSSTTSKVPHSAPRPPSTTPATSTSARACATCPRYAKSAFRPTVAFWKQRASHTTACSPNRPSNSSIFPPIVQEQRASALRFADPMVPAIWKALLVFDRLPTGFCNRDLRNNLAALLDQAVEDFTQGPDELSVAAPAASRPDRTYSQNSPLPLPKFWLPCRDLLHPHLPKDPPSRPWAGAAGNVFVP